MAYIVPNTIIRLLSGVPLNKDYENTILFDNVTAQTNYFLGKTKYSFPECTYQRYRPEISISGLSADLAMTCNYLMYQNTSYSSKWFYAFIDSVEYVNDTTCRINFTPDLMQTWAFDYELTDCFIERNHTAKDSFATVSLTSEPVQLGEYVDNSLDSILNNEWAVVVASVNVDETDQAITASVVDPLAITVGALKPATRATRGHLYQGIYSGLTYCVFKPEAKPSGSNQSYVDFYIGEIIRDGRSNSIVAIYVVPRACFGTIPDSGLFLPDGAVTTDLGKQVAGITTIGQAADSLDGYVPKNKKLYSYPFNYMEVTNGSGGSLALRYEMFNDYQAPRLSVRTNVQIPVTLNLCPLNYNRLTPADPTDTLPNHDYQIALGDFPQCSWNVDTYEAWAAQNSINMSSNIAQLLTGSAQSFMGGITAGLTNIATAGIGFAISQALQAHKAMRASDQIKGNTSTGSGAIAQGRQNFYVKRKSINRQYAKIADDYFTMFGYTINALSTPGDDIRRHRPHYTYVKTIGCDISGALPAEDMAAINGIFDKGVRFWLNPAEIGNYSLDNSPT